MSPFSSNLIRYATGLVIGAIIAYVDNFSFQGEVSPIVVVILLLISTLSVSALWKWHGLSAIILIWLWLPLVHFTKKVLGLPDTLHPNTYNSILMFTVFTFIISAIGFLFGILISKIFKNAR